MQVLKTVIRASQEQDAGRSDDSFWETALDMLIAFTIDLCKLAYGKVSIPAIYEIVQSIPKNRDEMQGETEDGEVKAFQKAFEAARKFVTAQIDLWVEQMSDTEREKLKDDAVFQAELLEAVPDARLLKMMDGFFFDTLINLSDKTRSIIDFSFAGFLFRRLREPIYSLFCRYGSTLTPEDSLRGRIILVNLPVKTYEKPGRDAQILFKYCWQRAMEKRNIAKNDRPVFLLERVVRPEEFQRLRTGGPLNDYRVEGYLYRQGDSFMNGKNHIKMRFDQNYFPQ